MRFHLAQTKHLKIQLHFIPNLWLYKLFNDHLKELNKQNQLIKIMQARYQRFEWCSFKENLFHYDLLQQIVGGPSRWLNPEFRLH